MGTTSLTNVTCSGSVTCQSYLYGGTSGANWQIDTSGNATLGGTLSVAGSYGAYARMTLSTTSYANNATSDLLWNTASPSSLITLTNGATHAILTQAGVYVMQVSLTQGNTYITGAFVATLSYSTNSGSTWTSYQSGQSDNITTADYSMTLQLNAMASVAANSWWKVTIYNPAASLFVHYNATSVSTWHIYRVG